MEAIYTNIQSQVDKAANLLKELNHLESINAPEDDLDAKDDEIFTQLNTLLSLKSDLNKAGVDSNDEYVKKLDDMIAECQNVCMEEESVETRTADTAPTSQDIPSHSQPNLESNTPNNTSPTDLPKETVQSSNTHKDKPVAETFAPTNNSSTPQDQSTTKDVVVPSEPAIAGQLPITTEASTSIGQLPTGMKPSWVTEKLGSDPQQYTLKKRCGVQIAKSGLSTLDCQPSPSSHHKCITLLAAKLIPLPTLPSNQSLLTVETRVVRACLLSDDNQIVSNILTVKVVCTEVDPRTWVFPLPEGELVVKTRSSSVKLLLELNVVVKRQSSSTKAVLSCGWCTIPIAAAKTGSAPLNGGTPLDRGISLPADTAAAGKKSLFGGNKSPRIEFKVGSPHRSHKVAVDWLPHESIVSAGNSQLLIVALTKQIMSKLIPISNPQCVANDACLAAILDCLESPDILALLPIGQFTPLEIEPSNQRINEVKDTWRSTVILSATCDNIANEYPWTDVAAQEERRAFIAKVQRENGTLKALEYLLTGPESGVYHRPNIVIDGSIRYTDVDAI